MGDFELNGFNPMHFNPHQTEYALVGERPVIVITDYKCCILLVNLEDRADNAIYLRLRLGDKAVEPNTS